MSSLPSDSPRQAACHCLGPTPRLPLLPLAAAVLVVLLMAAQSFPAVVRLFFCAPSAWLSAQFLGVDVLPLADGFQLDCPQLPVDVSLACSGTTFFAMLLVLLTVHELGQAHGGPRARARRRASLFGAGALLTLAYSATLAANTARIVLGWHAAVWAHAALPPSFHSGVHLVVGIVVFSGFLAAAVLATRWRPASSLECGGLTPLSDTAAVKTSASCSAQLQLVKPGQNQSGVKPPHSKLPTPST